MIICELDVQSPEVGATQVKRKEFSRLMPAKKLVREFWDQQ